MGVTALTQEALMSGIVTKVDEPQGAVRIQYGKPGETSGASVDISEDFKVKDRVLFNSIRAGDRVWFSVEQTSGARTITKMEKRANDD
jgi:Cu/Ag efflux protein CusF